MKKVVVVGASGFGREVLDVLDAMIAAGADLEIIGVVDDSPSAENLDRLKARDVAYLGTRDDWMDTAPGAAAYVLGIGHPAIKHTMSSELEATGLVPFTAVHPSATLGARTTLAEGVVICAGAVVSNNVKLGRHVHINPNATIGHDADLQAFVSINPSAVISGEVLVGEGSLIGAAATILQSLTVGERVIVGAGSVVTTNVPPDVVVKGVPGRW